MDLLSPPPSENVIPDDVSKALFKTPIKTHKKVSNKETIEKDLTLKSDDCEVSLTPTNQSASLPDLLSPSPNSRVITNEILEKIRTHCSRHKIIEMANFLGINKKTLAWALNKQDFFVTNSTKDPS